jgi:hypothetical protein
MASAVAIDFAPDMPQEVLDFASAHHVLAELPLFVAAAQDSFAGAVIRSYLESDPEMPDEKRIIVEVDVNGRTVGQLATAEDRFEQLCRPHRTAGIVCLRLSQGG